MGDSREQVMPVAKKQGKPKKSKKAPGGVGGGY